MRQIRQISLIEPKGSDHHVYSNFYFPRLGLPLLATILKNKGYEVRVFCEDIKPLGRNYIINSDLIGISTITASANASYKLAKELQEAGKLTVMGGIHVSFCPDEALQYTNYCVRGEGEETILELIDALKNNGNNGDFSHIKGLSYKADGIIKHNPQRPFLCDLDSLPFVDFSPIDGLDSKRFFMYPIQTSRGCPYNCEFCSVTTMFGRKYRYRSVENVLDELSFKRPRRVFFYDDNFVVDKERTRLLLEGILKRNLKLKLIAQTRVDVGKDIEFLKLMRRAGFRRLYIGFESINSQTLKEYNKSQGLTQIIDCIENLHRCNIEIHGMFVFGGDSDDISTIKETVRFVKQKRLESVQFLILTPIPGSRTYHKLKAQNRLLSEDWSLYDGHHVVYKPNKILPFQLQHYTYLAYKAIYSFSSAFRAILRLKFVDAYIKLCGKSIITKWWRKNKKRIMSFLSK